MTAGQRLQRVRELRGLRQGELASAAGVDQPTLSRWERDQRPIDPEILTRIAGELDFPESYFSFASSVRASSFPPLAADTLRFRARAGAPTRELTQSRRWGEVVMEQAQSMVDRLKPIPVQLPRCVGAPPVQAAQLLRHALGLNGVEPVPYLVVAVERLGVQVLGLPFSTHRQDAFASWSGTTPVLAVLAGAPGDRLRFSVAHELGHLLLHDEVSDRAVAEAEADEFAAELLAPLDGMRIHLPSRITLTSLTPLKAVWGVSLRTLIRQAHRAGRLDQDRYTSLFRQISARGWTKTEPAPVSIEKPRGFRKMAELLYGQDPEMPIELARDAEWSVELAADIIDQHAAPDELPTEPARVNHGNVISLRPLTRQ